MTTLKSLLLFALRAFIPVLVGAMLVPVTPALASEAAPQWTVSAVSRPTNFAVGGKGDSYVVLVTNSGSTPSTGTVTISDELPAGVSSAGGVSARDELLEAEHSGSGYFGGDCSQTSGGGVACSYSGVVQPDDTLSLTIPVEVAAGPPVSCAVPSGAVGCVMNVVRVTGGGAPVAGVMEASTAVFQDEQRAGEAATFGIAPGGAGTALSSVQAGAHPDLTTTFALDTENAAGATAGDLKNVTYDLPPGFAGDLVDTPACPAAVFLLEECPVATQVGVTTVTLTSRYGEAPVPQLEPVYNLAPEPGGVAKIGFPADSFHYEGDVSVRAPGEPGQPYGLRTTFYDSTAATVNVSNVALTVWGVPASPVHDPLRWDHGTFEEQTGHFGVASSGTAAPYLSNPTSCTAEPLQAAFTVTSWQEHEPGAAPAPAPTPMAFGPIVGCDLSALWMEPKLTAEVTSDSTGSPTGLNVDTNIRQTYPNPELLATSTLKKEVVSLPEGMTLNPSAGAGLAACSLAQYGEESTHELTGLEKEEGHGCPNAAKLATVRIKTPSISEEVTGSVFLAQPYENPFAEAGHPNGSLLAMYLIARANNRGVLVKTPGQVTLDPVTGRITATFDSLPPLPFSLAAFEFNQGANAPLITPPTCGNFTVTAELTPWSNPEGSPLTPEIRPFPISTNCPSGGVPPFAPQVTAGTDNNAAGSYSPLYLRIERHDGEQEITGFATALPPGLTGNLDGIPFCGEAEITAARGQTGAEAEASPACPAASQIGHTIAEAGVGSVLAQTPGRLYLGGAYEGAPFSVISVTSAKVGPFDLGTVVVHLPLDINPDTAQVTIPPGPADQIPHIIKGIVIHLRNIRVYIDREKFMLNPTSCAATSFGATIIGAGADPTSAADNDPVTVADPFQAADCANLAFAPKFSAATPGKASKANGAGLTVKLTYPNAPQGTQANIRYVKVDLPKQLPSELRTLQKACLVAVFDANPASCPPDSIVGHATALTPILPVPLTGPAYFVSHGGAKFPELIMVLQGYGVTIDLHGETFISKAGITSSTFSAVPDQPVTSFELTLPEGPFSALGTDLPAKAKYSLCGQKLIMPTHFIAQNGHEISQSTAIAVTGCQKAKKKKKAKKPSHTKHHKKP